jgi:hypothetical protein
VDEPSAFEIDGRSFCRLHHEPLVFDPAWAFSIWVNYTGTGMGVESERFPNAKWGHAATPEMAGHEWVGLWHCPACEAERQRWLAAGGRTG